VTDWIATGRAARAIITQKSEVFRKETQKMTVKERIQMRNPGKAGRVSGKDGNRGAMKGGGKTEGIQGQEKLPRAREGCPTGRLSEPGGADNL